MTTVHHDTSSNTIFGFWVYLMTDCVMFATFFAVYAVLHNNTFGGPTAKELLDLRLALAETLILLTSSFTCAVALLSRNTTPKILFWFSLTFLLGLLFLLLQCIEFNQLISHGHTWKSNAFLSSLFTLLGVHSLHLLAGLLMMIVFLAQLLTRGLTPIVLRRLTCLRIYWQFVYLIWIFTFAIVYLMGAQ